MVKVRGSKDGDVLTAKFNGGSKSFFSTLRNTKSLVLLSVSGNEYCAEGYLKAIIYTALSTHHYVSFLVADEIYWHNLRQDFSCDEEIELKNKALVLGDNYLENNLKYFVSALDIDYETFQHQYAHLDINSKVSTINDLAKEKSNFEIVRWQSWVNSSPLYCSIKQKIEKLFNEVDLLKESVKYTADNFSNRHQNERNHYNILLKRSTGYLIEESPAVIWIAASQNYNFIVYPGEMIRSFKASKDYFIKKLSEHDDEMIISSKNPQLLVNWLEVSFTRSHSKKSHARSDDINEKINLDKLLFGDNTKDSSAIFKGVTEGVLSLNIEKEEKIELLIDIIMKYKQRPSSTLSNKLNDYSIPLEE